jgi:hypothetical protein
VLVSDIPSNLEVVGDPARIFHVGDCEEMGSKLTALTAQKWNADQRDAVRRESTSRYDWADIAQRTMEVYDEVLGRKNNEGTVVRTVVTANSGQRRAYDGSISAGYGLVRSGNEKLVKPLARSGSARVDLK